MSPTTVGVLFIGCTLLLLMLGVPIAFSLGATAVIFLFFFLPPIHLELMPETIYGELNSFALLTIPLFVLMGAAIGKSRASSDLYNSLHRWLSWIPGGLGVANVLACTVFAALCGSSPATCSAIGSMGIPELRKRGYPAWLAAGLIAAGGTLGILIPPSITMIIYGLATSTSIGSLFIAGVLPGLMLSAMFCAYVVYAAMRARRAGDADLAAAQAMGGSFGQEEERYSWKERLETLPRLAPFVILVALIMYALYGGWATPSEVAGVGAFLSLTLVILLYKVRSWADFRAILGGTVRESTMLMIIIGTAALYTYTMNQLGITKGLGDWLVQLNLGKWGFFIAVNLLMLVLGCFLPPVAIIVMLCPIILPALKAYGIDLIWFGVILTINMEMGLLTPPVGLNLFVINGIAPDIKFREIVRGIMPFLWLMVIAIALLCLFPEIATWLPNRFLPAGAK
ncbi:MAG: TRAP transporter large permease [Verrucomicrobia bacterium]|nr:TRAP transporter large permease [Verrucomicrobiota bacterium]